MKVSHLKEWFADFPDLRFLLSKEDKKVLDEIDPRIYKDFRLTKESVVQLIERHKPQAWKWDRLFPNLRNLPVDERVILDHLIPTDYVGDLTEADVRRIIKYRKDQRAKELEESEVLKAERYYEEHKTEIENEERQRSLLTTATKFMLLSSITLATSGVVSPSIPHGVIGALLGVSSLVMNIVGLGRLNKKSVIPISKKPSEKFDFLSVAFVIFYYIGFIGAGITLGTVLVWEQCSWSKADTVLMVGLITTLVSVFSFILVAIVTPSKK